MNKNLETPKKEPSFVKHIAELEKIVDSPKMSELNQLVLRHIIEEALNGNFDKAERILAQKRLVEMNQDKNHQSKLPPEIFESLIPIIKDYMKENGILVPESSGKQTLAENIKNIESKTLPPDIKNIFDQTKSATINEHMTEKTKEPILKTTGEIVSFEETNSATNNSSNEKIPNPETSQKRNRVQIEMSNDPDILAYENRPKNLDILSDEYRELLKKSIKARERIIKNTQIIHEKNQPENIGKGDFIALEKQAEKEKLIWKKELAREFQDDMNNEIIKAFDENPYQWIQGDIKRKISYFEKAIQKAKSGKERELLQNRIISLENRLPPIQYILKKEAISRFKAGDTLLITENGNTVKYKIIEINQEKVRFQKEGQSLISFLSRRAMEDFLLNSNVSFRKEKIKHKQKNIDKNNNKNSGKDKDNAPVAKISSTEKSEPGTEKKYYEAGTVIEITPTGDVSKEVTLNFNEKDSYQDKKEEGGQAGVLNNKEIKPNENSQENKNIYTNTENIETIKKEKLMQAEEALRAIAEKYNKKEQEIVINFINKKP